MTTTTTAALALALTLSPAMGIHGPATSAPDTDEVSATCDAVGYRYYAHRVAAGEMAPDVWPGLEKAGWVVTFAGPSSPVLVSPSCYLTDPYDV
jgi:hypothetical protein